MKVAVFISGFLTCGLESPTNGEGRWGIQLAKMLASKGHEVDCISNIYSTLGGVAPPPNINVYSDIPPNSVYDIAIYMPWEHVVGYPPYGPCTDVPIKSEWYVHCTFGWGDSIATDHTCYNNNHVLAFPYIQHGNQFPTNKANNPYHTFPLPIPIYDKLSPLNLKNRRFMTWPSKAVFHPEWPADHYIMDMGINVLKAMNKIAVEYGLGTVFVGSDNLLDNPS